MVTLEDPGDFYTEIRSGIPEYLWCFPIIITASQPSLPVSQNSSNRYEINMFNLWRQLSEIILGLVIISNNGLLEGSWYIEIFGANFYILEEKSLREKRRVIQSPEAIALVSDIKALNF